MIEYANIMSSNELSNFFQSISQLYDFKKNNSKVSLLENGELLVNAYYEYERESIKVFSDQRKEIKNSIKAWNEKKCMGCGSKLNLIESDYSNFWGCPNYRNKNVAHTTFNVNQGHYLSEKLERSHVRIDAHWATHILRKTNLKETIKAKELIDYYLETGLEDLREKYGYQSTIESISGYINAKRNSRVEEEEITKHLTKLFPMSQIQMGIKYKLVDEKEKVAIIDLILSDNDVVNIIEIKRSNFDIKPEQLKLYHSLVSFVLSNKSDKRICQGIFIVYKKENYSYSDETKYIIFDKLKNIDSKEKVSSIFEKEVEINGR